jgi:Asp-tRNA(Asn)/Glu-tRNA(Gln) amidotransferase A subunit family amidase
MKGTAKNPYDQTRVPAGSSGGTATAVAANFGTVGLGTDTGNSIRGPSSHCCLVGLRPTIGLTSRDGIIPLYTRNDVGGPMCRTVEDIARLLDIIAGYDLNDPITERCLEKIPETYTEFLDPNGLKEARIGILRHYTEKKSTDPEIKNLFEKAIVDLKSLGAVIVDPFIIPDLENLTEDLWCRTFKKDLERYLTGLGEKAPYKTLKEIIQAKKYSPYSESKLREMQEIDDDCQDVYNEPKNKKLRYAVISTMLKTNVEAFIFPTWSNPPRKLGDLKSPHGNNSNQIPPHTGMPAITVPMGFTRNGLPTGLQIVAWHFNEQKLIQYAYSYEQATKHRKPPKGFPRLRVIY